jgi:hypothetical protein
MGIDDGGTVDSWLPIQYRGFYDVPRMFVTRADGKTLLFDCAFDAKADEYSCIYEVYTLDGQTLETAGNIKDWRSLRRLGHRTGSVAVKDVTFDETRRKSISASTIDRVC